MTPLQQSPSPWGSFFSTTTILLILFLHSCLVVLAGAAGSSSSSTTTTTMIWRYPVHSNVTDLSSIAEDIAYVDELLSVDNAVAASEAQQIYEQGAFSRSYAELRISDGLPVALLPLETLLLGHTESGDLVVLLVDLGPHNAGDKHLRVLYHNPNQPPETGCHYGGLVEPIVDGCLVAKGELRVSSSSPEITFKYEYNPATDNRNERSLAQMSKNAHSKFRPLGSGDFYKDFDKFATYYDHADFADRMIQAAFARSTFQAGGFLMDYSEFDWESLRVTIVHIATYLIVGQFVLRELETALIHCDHHCGPANCNPEAQHAVDAAVAFYTGSLYNGQHKGNLLFGLADRMCQKFRTCGDDAADIEGHAHVNIEIFQHFVDMRTNLDGSHCLEAKKNKEAIARQLFVPLLQASLLATYLDALALEESGGTVDPELAAERAVFMATVLPIIHYCDGVNAADLHARTRTGAEGSRGTFETVKRGFEATYRCLGITCIDVGGIYGTTDYVPGAESCYESPPQEPTGLAAHKVGAGFLAFFMLLVACCIYLRNRKQWDDDDSEDGDPEDEEEMMIVLT